MLVLDDVQISSNIPVMLALADLKMIQSVLQAMDIADLSAAAHTGAPPLQNPVSSLPNNPDRVELIACKQPQSPIGHEVYRASPKGVAPIADDGFDSTKLWGQTLQTAQPPHGIQAPWEVQPWKEPPKLDIGPTIKFILHPPDHPIKGRLIDLFG